jgi:hypothetical protein
MNRRDLTKAMLVLPLAQLAAADTVCNKACASATTPLRIILEGPFGIVLKKTSSTSTTVTRVTAFTPAHAMHHARLNGWQLPDGVSHSLTLVDTGLAANSTGCVDTACKDFCEENTDFNCPSPNHFVLIDLPCPKQIYTTTTASITFESGAPGKLPQNHVLEYDIQDAGKPIGFLYQGSQFITPIANSLLLEVGMLRGVGNPKAHAIEFYNNYLLPCFPKLKNLPAKKLADITAPSRTTTLECKSGGLIAGTT